MFGEGLGPGPSVPRLPDDQVEAFRRGGSMVARGAFDATETARMRRWSDALVSIDRATAESGCLQIAAGQHECGLFRSWEPMSEVDMDGMDFVPCPTEPGDVMFFDCCAPHVSEPNLTDTVRRFYFAT